MKSGRGHYFKEEVEFISTPTWPRVLALSLVYGWVGGRERVVYGDGWCGDSVCAATDL